MTYQNIGKLLADCWGKPWSELFDAQRQAWRNTLGNNFDESLTAKAWDLRTVEVKKQWVETHDNRNDPELCMAFFDKEINARVWFEMPDVIPEDAAKLLCEINPIDDKSATPRDKWMEERFRLLLAAFQSLARAKPNARMLMDWKDVAHNRRLKYSPWIDTYALARNENAPFDAGDRGNEPVVVADAAAANVSHGVLASAEVPETKNWILLVQAEAAKRWKSLRSAGANPTKNNLKGDLATWCRETNVLTDGDINPSAEYIYRHVLNKWTPPKC